MLLAIEAPTLTRFTLQLFVILLTARLLGEIAKRLGFAPVVGELLTGILLGPSLLRWAAPSVFATLFPDGVGGAPALDAVGQLGLLFLLVLAGLETDLDLIRQRASVAIAVAAGSILVPFISGFALGWVIPAAYLVDPGQRLLFALFLATALSISAVPVIARVLIDLDVVHHDPTQILLAAALINDVIGWILLSVVAGIARRGSVDPFATTVTVGVLVGFFVVMFTVGQRVVDTVYRHTQRGPPIGQLSTLILLALGIAALAEELGIEAFLGAFVVGILVRRTDLLAREVQQNFEGLTLAVLAPVFFATAGLEADLTTLADPLVAALAVVTVAVAVGGKFVGTAAGASLVGRRGREVIGMGAGLNARGALELVVASVGLSLGVLTEAMYGVVVLVAILTTVVAVPILRWAFAGLERTEV
ncbi:cation:proton antiporter [Halococcus hamelinensis]|uniref:Sodium/hydrogen exchanger n=1 Tax=Halococcus hamelinensis 100A6 TaxID=1132509 RepID=M0LVZ0_9EURY|nr:cation:proton antiporter [Halococcus hamelinensis]EMA37626.1 sodium/hydrogen exchanger [Halococcus hamelinensis 100A6]